MSSTAAGAAEPEAECRRPLCCTKNKRDIIFSLELLCSGIIFGLFNNLSTVFNAKTLLEAGYPVAAGLSLFFLVFPGMLGSLVDQISLARISSVLINPVTLILLIM